jgi:hypothetical protein
VPKILAGVYTTTSFHCFTNIDLTAYQELHDGLEPSKIYNPLLKRYKVIGARCKVFLPEENLKGYKLAPIGLKQAI